MTHDVNAAILTGGQVLALRDGQVAWTGPASDLSDERILHGIFDTDFRLLEDPVTGLRIT